MLTNKKPKDKKCKICGVMFTPRNMAQKVCSPACALKLAVADRKKKEAAQAKAERADLAKRKQAAKTKSDLTKEAQAVFNRFIRLRDRGQPCISCGILEWELIAGTPVGVGGLWDAGHYLSRGAHPELRFDEMNCHKQCKRCNGGSGRFARSNKTVTQRYRENLIKKIGLEEVERLEGKQEPKHYTKEDLEQIKAHYQAKCRELEKIAGE